MKSVSYLDLRLDIDGKEKLLIQLYDKHDAFRIVKFPFFRGNIYADICFALDFL